MKNNAAYTSTLPIELLEQLNEFAQKLNMPKNQLIERALQRLFEDLKRAEYIRSFQRAAQDEEMISLAEEGLEDYLEMLDKQ